MTVQNTLWVAVAAACLGLTAVSGWCLDLTVGPQSGDVVGCDNHAIQAAVDAVARDGGGTVFVKTGTYLMYNSLFLRSGVSVVGLGPAPVLQKVDGFSARLVEDGAYGQTRIVVDNASNLKKGMGIAISDDAHQSAWYVEVRSIAGVEGNAITLDAPLDLDYLVSRNARVETSAPVICGLEVRRSRVENLIADGNRAANAAINGCRGAAIYLWKSENCTIDNCTARNFNGDGISIQVSPYCTVTRCKVYRNAGEGIHPGSGSHHTEVSACRMQDNGRAGLFVCWLVQQSRFSGNIIERNAGDGISIGHQDTDNVFIDNTIERNGRHGVAFRPEAPFNGAHRNTLQNNVIRDNGQSAPGDGIHVDGTTYDLLISGNTIEDTPRDGRTTQQNGIFLAAGVDGVKTRGNTIRGNAAQGIADQSGGLRNSLQM